MDDFIENEHETVAANVAATARRNHAAIEIVGERRRAYTPAFRSRVVKASFESGFPVREVARQHGIHVSLLYRWRQECRRRSRGPEEGPLVPVRVAEPVAQERQAPGQMEITFRDGSILRFGHDVPPERVERLIMLLRP